jgi:Uma2 family endonuclease
MPTTTTITGRMTAAEFMALPEDPNKTRYELVHGEVVVSPSPNFSHGYVVMHLGNLLFTHVKAHKLGVVVSDIDTPFGPDDVRRPDLLYFSTARLHLIDEDAIHGPPDLCVEVLSPSNRHVDRGDKFELYRDAGVPFYWIVDPMLKSVEAYRLEGTDYVPTISAKDDAVVRLQPFEDLEIRLAEIWMPQKLS